MVADPETGLATSSSSEFLGLRFAYQPDSSTEISRYAAIESTVLLHHTAEALLRLYLGHAQANPCPWLAVSSLRSFAKFKSAVESLSRDSRTTARQDDLLEVFSGRADRSSFALSDEEMDRHRDGLSLALRQAAEIFLEESNIYNATKHGLAVIAGESAVRITADSDPGPGIASSGIALLTLQLSDERRWRRTTNWLHLKRSIMLIHLWTELIRSLWESARIRYLGKGDPTVLRRLDARELQAMLAERPDGVLFTEMSWDVPHVDPSAESQSESGTSGHR